MPFTGRTQLESVYKYQRVIINAFTEVINRMSMVENYRKSIALKKQQLESPNWKDAAVIGRARTE